MIRVLITGATGFVGSRLAPSLAARGFRVRVALREAKSLPPGIEGAVIGDLADPRNVSQALQGIDTLIHCAGIAHSEGIADERYRQVNVEGTLHLARAAQKAGLRRFIFLSSVRAQAGPVVANLLSEADAPAPIDAYGRSKWEAEQALAALSLDHVALRPVLIYGPGVKGNMAALLRLARTPWPLPLGALQERRSLLSQANLIDAVEHLIRHDGILRRPFLIADEEALTIPQMIAALRRGMGRKSLLVPVPARLLHLAAKGLGREAAYARLNGRLEVDISALKALGWTPKVRSQEGLEEMAKEDIMSSCETRQD